MSEFHRKTALRGHYALLGRTQPGARHLGRQAGVQRAEPEADELCALIRAIQFAHTDFGIRKTFREITAKGGRWETVKLGDVKKAWKQLCGGKRRGGGGGRAGGAAVGARPRIRRRIRGPSHAGTGGFLSASKPPAMRLEQVGVRQGLGQGLGHYGLRVGHSRPRDALRPALASGANVRATGG